METDRYPDHPFSTHLNLEPSIYPPNPLMTDPRAAREAALAAAEARLRGDPSAVEREEKAQADKLAARRKKDEEWTPPGDKVDQETRRTFARLLDRGIIRDNGYRQALTCAEVSDSWSNNKPFVVLISTRRY